MQNSGLNKHWILILCAALTIVLPIFATTRETPESVAISSVAFLIRVYREENGGALPSSWEQLKSFQSLEAINKTLEGSDSFPIEKHYQFFAPTQIPMLDEEEGGQALLLRTVPIGERSQAQEGRAKLRRFVVYLRSDGEVYAMSLPEAKVQKMLKNAGVALKPEPGLPVIEYDRPVAGPAGSWRNAEVTQENDMRGKHDSMTPPHGIIAKPDEPTLFASVWRSIWTRGILLLVVFCGGVWIISIATRRFRQGRSHE